MLLLAVIPGIILFFVIWKSDKVEKEPGKLLLKLFLFGALTVVSAIVVGKAGEMVFGFLDPGSMLISSLPSGMSFSASSSSKRTASSTLNGPIWVL